VGDNELVDALSRNRLFEGASPDELRRVDWTSFRERRYQAGETIVEQGAPAGEMYLIANGIVRIVRKLADGRDLVIVERCANDFVGEQALIEDAPRSASVICRTDVRVYALDRAALFATLDQLPRLGAALTRAIANRLRESDSRTTSEVTRYEALLELNRQITAQKRDLEKLNEELSRRNVELHRKNRELEESRLQTRLTFSALSEALPGTTLDDTYRLETKIGEGGFGAVFRGTHVGLHRPVAIKVLHPTSAIADERRIARFRIEGIAACRLNHPNAVEVIDFGVSSTGVAYLVMELLRGYTLGYELRLHGKLSPERCVAVIGPVCAALAEAHGAGIVHRDIKPDNVFLHQTKRGEVVKVVDFGVAKLLDQVAIEGLDEVTQPGAFVGTPRYMAPELLLDLPFDGKADVYSVGVMLYHMLCGEWPFPRASGSLMSVLAQVGASPRALRQINPDLSESIERVVMEALAREPDARPNAKALGAGFAAAVAEGGRAGDGR
jgi:CRP-like cAMP-binding protein